MPGPFPPTLEGGCLSSRLPFPPPAQEWGFSWAWSEDAGLWGDGDMGLPSASGPGLLTRSHSTHTPSRSARKMRHHLPSLRMEAGWSPFTKTGLSNACWATPHSVLCCLTWQWAQRLGQHEHGCRGLPSRWQQSASQPQRLVLATCLTPAFRLEWGQQAVSLLGVATSPPGGETSPVGRTGGGGC